MDLTNLPRVADLLATIEPTSLHVAITGHAALERVLDMAIFESLFDAEAFELDRVPFNQKLALAVGLRILGRDSVPPYKALNAIRNKVAHDLALALDSETTRDLRSCLSAAQRKGLARLEQHDPLQCLREIIGILYAELRTAVEHRRESRLRAEAYNDITKEALAGANYGVAWGESRRALELDLAKRVETKKRQQGWTYESPSHGEGSWDISEFMFIAPK